MLRALLVASFLAMSLAVVPPEARAQALPRAAAPRTGDAPPSGPRGAELAALDRELERLRAERAARGLGGPIAVVAVGLGATAVVGATIGFLSLSIWADSTDGYPAHHERAQRRRALPYLIPGLVVASAGGAFLGVRIARRSQLGREIRVLERTRLALSFAPEAHPGGAGLMLRGDF